MQTFLPYPDMLQSLRCLDYRRLGKQRVEAKQILNALYGDGQAGWSNHPATKMWRGYEEALKSYHNLAILCWIERGYKNTMPLYVIPATVIEMPPWFGDGAFHRAHQSNLKRKDPTYYDFFDVPSDLEYIWPESQCN